MSSHDNRRRTVVLQTLDLEARLTPSQGAFDPNHLLVSFTATVPEAAAGTELTQYAPSYRSESLGLGLYRLAIPAGIEFSAAEAALRRLPGAAAVGPDYIVKPEAVPNDPIRNQNAAAGNAIGLPTAWTTTTGTGQTIVAVIDTGIDVTHPDLAPNLWVNPGEIAGNNRDDDGNGFIDDLHGVDFTTNTNNLTDAVQHGTHVAGILGAVGNNGLGVTGVDWRTRIMPLKFMGANGGLTSDAVRALDYAIRNGARIVNTSWGGSPYDAAFAAALSRARNAGVIVVASAGNYGADNDRAPFYPAAYTTQFDNVVGVAATDDAGNLASWSNFGAVSVTVGAPGVNITSTLPNGRYGALSGTSMAAPFVSGALALVWDQNPSWTYAQVLDTLKRSVDPLPTLQGKVSTGGRINVARMVGLPSVPPVVPVNPPPPAPTGDRSGPRVVSAVFSGARVGQFDRVRLTFSEAMAGASLSNATITIVGPAGAVPVSSVIPVAGTNGTQFTLMLSRAQTAAGTYTAIVNGGVRDVAGNRLDQNGNGRDGEPADGFHQSSVLAGTAGVPVTPPTVNRSSYTTGTLPVAVTARRTTRIEIAVTESFAANDTTLALNLNHPRTGDLSIRLTAPDGRRVTLAHRGNVAAATTFADRGGTKPLQALDGFQGVNARGIWVLEIFDLGDGAAGTLTGAALSFARPGIAAQSLWPAGALRALTVVELGNSSPQYLAAATAGRPDVIANI